MNKEKLDIAIEGIIKMIKIQERGENNPYGKGVDEMKLEIILRLFLDDLVNQLK